jgi:sialic acid synthase SpsE
MEDAISSQAQSRSSERRLPGPVESPPVQIAGREISNRYPPYIVAELSCNHSGNLVKALRLIKAAKEAGADAVKLQTYTPEELTSPNHPQLWSLYKRAQTPRGWHGLLFAYARMLDIPIFSSAFSVDGVKFLQKLGSPAIKIASAEACDEELLHAAGATGLPVIVSMGLGKSPPPQADILLHCVACYPSTNEEANLRAINTWSRCFSGGIGLSDHTPGYETAIAATALGAVMIEKHFKLSEEDDCIDADWSLDPENFKKMCQAVRAVWYGMGDGVIRPTCEPRKR